MSRLASFARSTTAVSMVVLVAGCALNRAAPTPMVARDIAATCPATVPVDTLVVLLPGAFDVPQDFVDEGFVDALAKRGIAADAVLVDATPRYYRDRTIVTRLETDVIAPARARGIRHVWIAGISIGGLGTLIYASERPGTVDGLLMIAPYVGEPPVIAEVTASGGLAGWTPPGTIPDEDVDRRIWQALKTLTSTAASTQPPVFLGFGVDDRLAVGHRVLAAALPAGRVFTAPGGHDWPAWRAVWDAMLDVAPLPRDAACVVAVPARRR